MESWRDDNAWQASFHRALRGDVEDLIRWRDEARAVGANAPPYRAASALLWFADVPGSALPAIAELEADARRAPHPLLAFAGSRVAKAALLAFDVQRLREARGWLSRISRQTNDRQVAVLADLATAWESVLVGADVDFAALDRVALEATSLGRPDIAIEATVTRAIARANSGDLNGALADARVSSQAASVERLPQQTYFANVVLARLRRLGGRWYLATRILNSLLGSASSPWRTWLSWEAAFAQGDSPSAIGPATDVVAALRAAGAGDRARYGNAITTAEHRVRDNAMFARDVAALRGGIEVELPAESLMPEIRAWRAGEVDEPPFGLAGLQTRRGDESLAYVLLLPGGACVRVLGLGAALVSGTALSVDPELTQRKHSRVDSLIAALALCGSAGATEEELFRRVYGFRYVPLRHRDILAVAVHRARSRLGSQAEIVADGPWRWLRAFAPLLTADPRCASPVDERILLLVAHHRQTSAKGIADEVGMPLRTAQAALKRLVDEGLCSVKRDGRMIEYRVEDTTFQDPTSRSIRRPP